MNNARTHARTHAYSRFPFFLSQRARAAARKPASERHVEGKTLTHFIHARTPLATMSEPYRDWILGSIDSLRSRKARPDLERICRMVKRRHGSDWDRTRTELEKLIEEQTVLKVNYKGSVSYRNAAKVLRGRRKPEQGKCAVKQPSPPDWSTGDSALGPADEDQMEDMEVSGPSAPSGTISPLQACSSVVVLLLVELFVDACNIKASAHTRTQTGADGERHKPSKPPTMESPERVSRKIRRCASRL